MCYINLALLNRSANLNNNSTLFALNPYWVTGFTDAEGCFSMSILRSKTSAIGWIIEPCYIITLHIKDLELLNSIHKFFKVGAVSTSGKNLARYRVRSREDLKIIIEHFKNYPLQTSKSIHFAYFCEILNLMNSKTHTGNLGFFKLVSLINRLNIFAFFAIFAFLMYGFDLSLFGESFF